MSDDDTGFEKAPARYMATGREAIDQIREELGDQGFIAFCIGTALKYRLRAGHKGSATIDNEKERWYTQMALHVQGLAVDPRRYR